MRYILLLAVLASIAAGVVLGLILRRHRTDFGRSRHWYNPAHWLWLPWKAGAFFTPQGVRLFWVSKVFFVLGAILYLVTLWLY